jgi:RecA/RadA recombinase
MVKKNVEAVREALLETESTALCKTDESRLLSTGCTLINLAITNNWKGGITPGTYYWLCGESASGKSWLVHSILAEAANNPMYDDYRLIYDDAEHGAMMNIESYFGKKLAARYEAPATDAAGLPVNSAMVEDFYDNLDNAVKAGKPFIYVLDSMDSLYHRTDDALFEENKDIRDENKKKGTAKDVKASYGTDKAKYNSQNIKRVVHQLWKTGSILLVITQTRDNITGFGAPKTVGGGRALKFYAHAQIWMKPAGDIKKTVNSIPRIIGSTCNAEVKKNRFTGGRADVDFNIYNSYGIDDLGSCIDYLITEKVIEKSGSTITIPAMELSGLRERVIMDIEENNREDELRQLVGDTWNGINKKTQLQRKPRYE